MLKNSIIVIVEGGGYCIAVMGARIDVEFREKVLFAQEVLWG